LMGWMSITNIPTMMSKLEAMLYYSEK